MKKLLGLLLATTMVLSLTGCGKEAKLYEKYAELITELENAEFEQAMASVAKIAAEEQAEERMKQEEEDRAAVMQKLLSDWYLYSSRNENAPEAFTFLADGTWSMAGTELKWMEKNSSGEWIEGIVTNGDKNLYFFQCNDVSGGIPELSLFTCQENDYGVYAGDHLATYVTNPMYPVLFVSWNLLDGTDGLLEHMYFGRNAMTSNDKEFKWTALTDGKDDTLTIKVAGYKNTSEEYTMELANKDGHYVIAIKDEGTGEAGLYYNYDYGYEKTWEEYLYPKALGYLKEYQEYNYFWCSEDSVSYENHEAGAYLYNLFSKLGTYKDSAEIAGRFTILPDMYKKAIVSRVDNLGNTSGYTLEFFNYDKLGRIVSSNCEENLHLYGENGSWDGVHFSYDDSNRISQVQYGNVTAIITPKYDDANNMIGAQARYNTATYDYTYSYNDDGQLILSETYDSYYKYIYELTYNEDGKVLQTTYTRDSGSWKDITVADYVYDSQGYLISKQLSEYDVNYSGKKTLSSVTTYTYKNDTNGHPISAEITTDPSNGYASQVVEYIYTDLYFYEAE